MRDTVSYPLTSSGHRHAKPVFFLPLVGMMVLICFLWGSVLRGRGWGLPNDCDDYGVVSPIKGEDGPQKSSSKQLAFDQSFGFFDDIDDASWVNLYQQRARNAKHHKLMNDPLRDWDNPPIFYLNNYEPTFSCPHVRRVGGTGDGPKWVCDPHRLVRIAQERRKSEQYKNVDRPCLVYSIGSAGRIEFELGLTRDVGADTCEVHIFDPGNFHGVVDKYPNMAFHSWGMKSSYDDSHAPEKKFRGAFKSLPDTIKELGHEGRTIDILKIDCEGCEWFLFQDFYRYDIRQILIETHALPTRDSGTTPLDYFDSYEKNGYVMFYKEPNIHPAAHNLCVEFAYLKLKPEFLGRAEIE